MKDNNFKILFSLSENLKKPLYLFFNDDYDKPLLPYNEFKFIRTLNSTNFTYNNENSVKIDIKDTLIIGKVFQIIDHLILANNYLYKHKHLVYFWQIKTLFHYLIFQRTSFL